MSKFIRCELIRISSDHNSQAEALAKLASTSDMKLPRTITIFRLPISSLSEDQEIGVLIPDPIEETTPIVDVEGNNLSWSLDEEISKVIETGIALGFDFGNNVREIRNELAQREEEDAARILQ
ncbi:hypothetical protein LWI29_038119 [Acer saccharum]|uniref:Uncharacterized protein n=1 Tax=Acer saccharum TaxID=4024 RepID=A0AA39VCL3_ACESA|nr:hypothetical protein LWI29_038119 [Acer saccharum]